MTFARQSLGSLAVLVFGVAVSVLLPRILGPAARGEYQLAVKLAGLELAGVDVDAVVVEPPPHPAAVNAMIPKAAHQNSRRMHHLRSPIRTASRFSPDEDTTTDL